MSQEMQQKYQQLAQLPDLGQAEQFLQQNVLQGTFMRKLAEYGIQVQSQQELNELFALSQESLEKIAEEHPEATMLDIASSLMEKSASADEPSPELIKLAEEANIIADNIDVYRSVMALTLARNYTEQA